MTRVDHALVVLAFVLEIPASVTNASCVMVITLLADAMGLVGSVRAASPQGRLSTLGSRTPGPRGKARRGKEKERAKAKEAREDKAVERASGRLRMSGTLAGGARPGDNQATVGGHPIATRGPPRGLV